MAGTFVPDDLWRLLEPLVPPPARRRIGGPGRRRLDDRRCLEGILFVLRTGSPWAGLPGWLGFGSGMTCWRRLREWREAGAWEGIQALLRAALPEAGEFDWSRAAAGPPGGGGPAPSRGRDAPYSLIRKIRGRTWSGPAHSQYRSRIL